MFGSSQRNLAVSPRQLAQLYHRCIRCLYERVHGADETELPGSTFRSTAVEAMECARGTDGWIEIPGADAVRIISQEQRADSAPIPFEDFGIGLVFRSHPATLLETKGGKKILCTYREREENATLRSVLRCSLEAAALAAEHPADQAATPVHVDELGIIEFSMRLMPVGKGSSKRSYRPARLIRMKREPDRFALFLRIVARILAGRKPPPANAECPHCSRARAGDKVPA